MTKSQLLEDLQKRCEACIEAAETFNTFSLEHLQHHPDQGGWNIPQCLEHLNLYGDFYLPEIERRILGAEPMTKDHPFKSGWFGEKTVNDMLPKADKVRMMRTFKDKDPMMMELDYRTIDRFIKQQRQMIKLLQLAKDVHISKVKTKLTLPILRFKLGTTFRFVIYHQERHIWQAQRVASKLH